MPFPIYPRARIRSLIPIDIDYPNSARFIPSNNTVISSGLPSSLALPNTTMACWVKYNSTGAEYPWSGVSGRNSVRVLVSRKLRAAWVSDNCESTNLITLGQWYHIVYICNPTGLFLYVNGSLWASNTSMTGSQLFTVGGDNSFQFGKGNVIDVNDFSGSLWNWSIWNVTWTTDDISYCYSNPSNLPWERVGTSITASNCEAHYKFENGAGISDDNFVSFDSIGNGRHGLLINETTPSNCFLYDSTAPGSFLNTKGFTLADGSSMYLPDLTTLIKQGVYIPRRENDISKCVGKLSGGSFVALKNIGV